MSMATAIPADATRGALEAWIAQEEGLRLTPYRCPSGKLSIGYGRNLDDVGISREEALVLFASDLRRAWRAVEILAPWATALDPVRHGVLVAMAYQLGGTRLAAFKQMLHAVEAGRYDEAARHMLASKWADQTPGRAGRSAAAMRTGQWPELG